MLQQKQLEAQNVNLDNSNYSNSIQQNSESQKERISETIDSTTHQKKKENKNNKKYCPLTFICRVGNNYIISYKQNQSKRQDKVVGRIIIQILVTSLMIFATIGFIYKFTGKVPEKYKQIVLWLGIFNTVMFVLTFFIDAGTLLEDEEENMYEDQIYCSTCKLYKHFRTKHCQFCVTCVRYYDHHCAFFGKCIGRNNIIFFAAFVFGIGIFGFAAMGSLIIQLFSNII